VSEREPGAMEKAKGLAKEAAGAMQGDEDALVLDLCKSLCSRY
jgi:hypothetical protein